MVIVGDIEKKHEFRVVVTNVVLYIGERGFENVIEQQLRCRGRRGTTVTEPRIGRGRWFGRVPVEKGPYSFEKRRWIIVQPWGGGGGGGGFLVLLWLGVVVVVCLYF